MISPLVVDEIRRLLQQRELSQRAIAGRLGVSRGTVNAVFLGKRRDHGGCGLDREDPAVPWGPPERCPGCGGMVQMPCLVCRIRWLRETRRFQQNENSAV